MKVLSEEIKKDKEFDPIIFNLEELTKDYFIPEKIADHIKIIVGSVVDLSSWVDFLPSESVQDLAKYCIIKTERSPGMIGVHRICSDTPIIVANEIFRHWMKLMSNGDAYSYINIKYALTRRPEYFQEMKEEDLKKGKTVFNYD